MTTRTRRTLFPKVVIERDTDTEESSDDEEELEVENDVVESGDEEEEVENDVVECDKKSDVKGKAPITISLKKVCKVCKKTGHQAGFQGATYIDCPMKPCFLCKLPGHTTVDCPHRAATEFGVIPASRKRTNNSLDYVFERQMRPRVPSIKPAFVIPDEVNCAVIRYHSRRITCLEFHPTNNNILLSGDKKGQLGVWDFSKVYERTVYGNIHSCLLNNMKFSPANDGTVYSASSDGTVSSTDLEAGLSTSIMNLNPNGWQGGKSWRMLYGMELNTEKNLVLVADSFGYLHLVDVRSDPKKGDSVLIHKKGTKVVGLHCNPLQPDLLLSCGNDHFARIWDMRRLEAESCLHELPHKRVVNSAYFSPTCDLKITWGISVSFISVILLPNVGNAAEHAGSIIFAYKNKLDISLGVAMGSATQISTFLVPLCVIVAWIMGIPMSLDFGLLQTGCLAFSVLLTALTLQDGSSHYLKGLILCLAYVVIGACFFVQHVPSNQSHANDLGIQLFSEKLGISSS